MIETFIAVLGGAVIVARALIKACEKVTGVNPQNIDATWVKESHKYLRMFIKAMDKIGIPESREDEK